MARAPERARPVRARLAAAFLAALLPAGLSAAEPAGRGPRGTQHELPLAEGSPLAAGLEIARRALTPLTFRAVERQLLATGQALRDDPLDPERDAFSVYVPPGDPPPRGYGLLVFIAPWEEATRPRRWRPPLDRRGLILASAAGAGNETRILDRRVPMAVLAVENVRRRWPIDPERIYVGGMSDGSRSALVTALAFPDLFRGALLNAGSEPIDGSAGVYIPPADLFRRFQRMRLVYATGERDDQVVRGDQVSRRSLQKRCVLDTQAQVVPRLAHEPLDPPALEKALAALDRPARLDEAELSRCNAALEKEIAGRLGEAEAAIAAGDGERARRLLQEIDAAYGGLAAPAILELEERRVRLP